MSRADELEKRVQKLEVELQRTQEQLVKVYEQIDSLEPRGLARFDARTFDNPNMAISVFQVLTSLAEASPDGWVMREKLKKKAATQEDMLKTDVRTQLDRLLEKDFAESHPSGDGRIRPGDEVQTEDLTDLIVSNFASAESRRDIARERGKDVDHR